MEHHHRSEESMASRWVIPLVLNIGLTVWLINALLIFRSHSFMGPLLTVATGVGLAVLAAVSARNSIKRKRAETMTVCSESKQPHSSNS